MVKALESYLAGSWRAPRDEGVVVRDAATGEDVARVASAGIDARTVIDHARKVGGPGLRSRTFHERAAILKSLATLLTEKKKELYALSLHTGATRPDSAIDIDGGIGTLFSYASKGRRELPDDTVYLDGPPEQIGKKGSFYGQHVFTSREGVALQVNAFNFPCWGFLEKLAPAFLAGIPTIVKPATPTAYLTELVVRQILESGLMPEGTLQLLLGRGDDLFDQLSGQDVVAFTGSATTASHLRSHPGLVGNAVRFNAETDSLNCSILGPDAGPDSPEFALYVGQLVTEMRVKAGQKCTAIRRAIVPRAFLDDVAEAVKAELTQVVIGNPANEGVTMGPLVSLEQRDEVRASVARLAGGARSIYGDPVKVDVVDADPEGGAFIAPQLLLADDAHLPVLHEVEAFGPASTVMAYDSLDEAVTLAGLGEGSLVGSVVTHDPEFAKGIIQGTAAWHGRILILDRDCASESTGHGSPLPNLVHGGPGRAGGGEELGGIRAVLHHMQRTALQGSPGMITAATGRWLPGAHRDEERHPFRKYLEELALGDGVTAGPRAVTLDDIEAFAELTGDRFYAHMDEEAAKANPFFDGRVAHGYFVLSAAAGLFVHPDPGPVLANYGLENLRFIKPVYPGDELSVRLTAKEIDRRGTDPHGEVRWDALVTNQRGEAVAAYDVLTLVAKR